MPSLFDCDSCCCAFCFAYARRASIRRTIPFTSLLPPARAMRSVPVWAFHGADDKRVPIAWQELLIETLKTAGAQPKWTVYPGVGHESWYQAYADPELYDWMLAQRRQPSAQNGPARK